MRISHFQRGWVISSDGQMAGLALGYDHCAQHGSQAPQLRSLLGAVPVEAVDDIEDHRIGAAADCVHFETHLARCNGDRRKRYQAGFLVVSSTSSELRASVAALRNTVKPLDRRLADEPAMTAIMTAWGDDGFAVQVREAINIQRLESFRDDLLSGGLLMVAPTLLARGGPVFLVERLMPDAQKDWLRDQKQDALNALGASAANAGRRAARRPSA